METTLRVEEPDNEPSTCFRAWQVVIVVEWNVMETEEARGLMLRLRSAGVEEASGVSGAVY